MSAQQSFIVGGQPVAGYRTIVADPPWQYDDSGIRGAAEHHYETMPTEEICALSVGPLGAENSHLYLWVTNSFIEDGFDVMRAWGYRYITAITWVKDKIGCGHYFRNTTEHMLFGVRGSLPLKVANLPTHFKAPRPKQHSRKPDRSFEIVEEASHGPYLEIFARGEMCDGWTGWGNQATGKTIQIPEAGVTARRQESRDVPCGAPLLGESLPNACGESGPVTSITGTENGGKGSRRPDRNAHGDWAPGEQDGGQTPGLGGRARP